MRTGLEFVTTVITYAAFVLLTAAVAYFIVGIISEFILTDDSDGKEDK